VAVSWNTSINGFTVPLPFTLLPSTALSPPSKRRCGLTCLLFSVLNHREFSSEGQKKKKNNNKCNCNCYTVYCTILRRRQ